MFSLKNIYIGLVAISLGFLTIAIGTFICLIYFDFAPTEKFNYAIVLFPPIGILLSAFLASVSVLKNIENTNRIEEEKKEKEQKQFLNKLVIYSEEILSYIEMNNKLEKEKIKKMDNSSQQQLMIYLKENLEHTKNLIIKDISFIERIEKEDFEIIRDLNKLQIGLEQLIFKYSENIHNNIDIRTIELHKKIKSISNKYTLNLKEINLNDK